MKILFIGGDKRMEYTAEKLSENHDISRFGGKFSASGGAFDVIILPLPLSKDGKTIFAPNEHSPLTFDELFQAIGGFADEHTIVLAGGENPALSEFCRDINCECVNYFACETLTLRNASLTAESALCLLSQSTDGALLGSETLITGSGRIAGFLAERLRVCGSEVTIAARNSAKREQFILNGYSAIPIEELSNVISKFDYIVNTIPAPIFDENMFSKIRLDAVYQELASLPEQPGKVLAEHCGIRYIYAGGLPGKYSPKAAGEFIADTIEEIIRKRKE